MNYFPIFLNIKNKPVLVVGGGEVACRKIDMLLRAEAQIQVVSPTLHPHLLDLVEQQKIKWVKGKYQAHLLEQQIQVWATTDDSEMNHQVYQDAQQKGIMTNVVDDLPYCDFITPSMIQRGRIQIAISSGGASPVLIRYLREQIEAILPQNLGLLADFGAQKRQSIKNHFSNMDERRQFWEHFFSQPQLSEAVTQEALETLYQSSLSQQSRITGSRVWIQYHSDAECLSLKALHQMQAAELIFYPQACPFDFIDLCRRDADRIQYADPAHLTQLVSDAEQANKRVCIFISQQETPYWKAMYPQDKHFAIINHDD